MCIGTNFFWANVDCDFEVTSWGNEVNFFQQEGGFADVPISFAEEGNYQYSVNGGTFSTLTGNSIPVPVGNNIVVVKRAGCPTGQTLETIVVGDVFVVAGQSNATAAILNFQPYTGNGDSYMFNLDDSFGVLQDPTHPVPLGSPWPLVGSDLELTENTPLLFINTAQSATRIDRWVQSNGNLTTFGTRAVQQVLDSGVNAVKRVLWYQGESDVSLQTADYEQFLSDLASQFNSQMPGNPNLITGMILGRSVGVDATGTPVPIDDLDEWSDNIRNMQLNLADNNPLISLGPVTTNLQTGDGVHFESDAVAQQYAHRWIEAIRNDCYGGTLTHPRMTGVQTTSITTFEVTFDSPISPGPYGLGAFTIDDSSGNELTIVSATSSGPNTALVTVANALQPLTPYTVKMMHGTDAEGQAVPANPLDTEIVAIPFSLEVLPTLN